MIDIEKSPIQVTTQHTVTIRTEVKVDATAVVTFSEDDVREYYELDPSDTVTRELIEAYAVEYEDPDWDVDPRADFDFVGFTKVDSHASEKVTVVPPEFVALPGMEGL